jgi:hypothetical protein
MNHHAQSPPDFDCLVTVKCLPGSVFPFTVTVPECSAVLLDKSGRRESQPPDLLDTSLEVDGILWAMG